MRPSLRRNILVPLALGLVFLLAGFTSLLYFGQWRHLNDDRGHDRMSVERYFNLRIKGDADLMSATLFALARDQALRTAFLARDRAALQSVAQPIYEQLNQKYRITHMCFVLPDKVTLLRVHRMEAFGDTIPGVTMERAAQTGQLAYGLELGRPEGLFTLRVVLPWRDPAGNLIGYLELGEEIQHFPEELKRVLGVDLFVAIRKDMLDRESWEASMSMFGRVPSWGQFPEEVLIDRTMDVPAGMVDYFRKRRSDRERVLELRVGDKRYFGTRMPLTDAASREVGELIILRDHTRVLATTRRAFLGSAALAVLMGVIFTLLLYDRVRRFFITPLLELRAVSERAGRGELSQIALVGRSDELGDLARAINRMIVDLRAAQAEQTRLVLDAALDAVVTFDQSGQVIDWNRQAEALFGWSRSEAIDRNVIDLVGTGSIRAELEQALENYHDTGSSSSFNRLIEGRVHSRHGKQVPVETAITPVLGARGLLFSAFIRDVTDRTRLQEDLHAAQRLDAIGKLAGGIAHDFNNLITAIIGYVASLEEALPPGSQEHDDALEIRRAADRASGLVQQLLAFARKRVVQLRPVCSNELVTRVERMLRRLIGENIRLEMQLDSALWSVMADPVQLEQVVVNLSVNARDAMPNGGVITIRTSNIVISGALSADGAVTPGQYVMIAVTDTGVGMDQDTIAHIFEPFFTTKQAGKGTGLGLATCYGIVKQAGGYIRVTSSEGAGTSFRVYLPRAAEPAAAMVPPNAGAPTDGDATETILLVEDEYQVRRLIERALQQQGYQIITATNGAEAIRVSRSHDGPIHLLLTDVVMPEMSGPESAAIIRSERSDIRVVYMSGYSDELVRVQSELTDTAAFIAKPFAPSELRRLVRDLLDVVPV